MKNKTKAFVDRTPLRFIGGLFVLIIGIVAKSTPLLLLGVLDLIISFLFFSNPGIEDKKSFKFFGLISYGILVVWSMLWLVSKLP